MPQNKRILYVERDYLDGICPDSLPIQELHNNEGYQGFRNLRDSLRARFDLEWIYNFDEKVLEKIQKSMPEKKIDALVTHLPYEKNKDNDWRGGIAYPMLYYSSIYGKSLDLISRIKDTDPEIMILVYTGMPEDYHYLPIDAGADRVIKKSQSIQKDIKDVNYSLDYLFFAVPRIRAERKERANQPPIIKNQDNKTVVETRVNIRTGLGTPAYIKISEESRKYPMDVTFVNLTDGTTANCKDLLSLCGLLAFENTQVRIAIDGESPDAQILAKRLYSVITSEEERKINLNRFD
ncbi:Uncharacterised protein [uncultured archaeon]|nr:Uncharacterised protein [uncultured archaeon]